MLAHRLDSLAFEQVSIMFYDVNQTLFISVIALQVLYIIPNPQVVSGDGCEAGNMCNTT